MLWRALGFELSWHKGQRGSIVDWIGAQFGPWRTPSGRCGMRVTIPAEKISNIRQLVEQMLLGSDGGKGRFAEFRGPHGLGGELAPAVEPIHSHALRSTVDEGRTRSSIFEAIQMPLSWILAFTKALNGPLVRFYRPRSETITIISFDGSPSGGGATVQLAVPVRADRTKFPVALRSTRWKQEDES